MVVGFFGCDRDADVTPPSSPTPLLLLDPAANDNDRQGSRGRQKHVSHEQVHTVLTWRQITEHTEAGETSFPKIHTQKKKKTTTTQTLTTKQKQLSERRKPEREKIRIKNKTK